MLVCFGMNLQNLLVGHVRRDYAIRAVSIVNVDMSGQVEDG